MEEWNKLQRIIGRTGKPAHEDKLIEVLREYERDGYKVIKLNGKSPDGIVFKDGKAICIEILPFRYNANLQYYHANTSTIGKRTIYENLGFDEIKIIGYKLPKPPKKESNKFKWVKVKTL
jgi:hypothetical protein